MASKSEAGRVPSVCPEHGDTLDVITARITDCTTPGCGRWWEGEPPAEVMRRSALAETAGQDPA
ncbi:hypothetical protein [Pseudokineococcus sp. 1T1Z-3]|uniref:hypothetical protein n=1 Tax=Pseudokineococcus sp. 1T1Z-3 TaxID=3132745 RepID=UPI0030974AF4